MEPIRYFNRYTQAFETEQVYGERFLRWTYHHPLGAAALWALVKRPFFSTWYGQRMNAPKSTHKIAPFIQTYELDQEEFLNSPKDYANFNEFFFRRLKTEARPIDADPNSVTFPADGRHLGFQRASEIRGVFIKGQRFDLATLLGDAKLAKEYEHGSLVLSRLCPVDYHRFHFPAAGIAEPTQVIQGPLYSVSPIALRKKLSYLWSNKRTLTTLHTETFGKILILEIGATCVGTIQQTYTPGAPLKKGEEKGYFAFGGSSTITIFEPGKIKLAEDLLHLSHNQTELYAKFGDHMASLA